MEYLGAEAIGSELLFKPVESWSKENLQQWMKIQGVEEVVANNKFHMTGLMCLQIAKSEAYLIKVNKVMVFTKNDPLSELTFEIAIAELHNLHNHQQQIMLQHDEELPQLNIQEVALGNEVGPALSTNQAEGKRNIEKRLLDDFAAAEEEEKPTHAVTVEDNAMEKEHKASQSHKLKIRRLSNAATKRAIDAGTTVVATTRSSASSA